MQMPEFRQFNLMGGTALALQIGHRISIDLDLFTHDEYDSDKILQALQPFGQLRHFC
jgi:nucleotidyltransferase AbiEii toxin of type IV toxin-antitoxin system